MRPRHRLRLDGRSEHTLEQAVDLAGKLLSLVTLYCETAPHSTEDLLERVRAVATASEAQVAEAQ